MIPLPKPFGGVIVVGEHSIMYHNGANPRSIAMKTAIMRAWGKIDANGARILLGDHTGKLYILLVQNDGGQVTDMKLELLAETTAASTLNYLDNVLYLSVRRLVIRSWCVCCPKRTLRRVSCFSPGCVPQLGPHR